MYAPYESCIYCGRNDAPLSREHIIPYSLGGQFVLPRASCPDHAAITSQVEREVSQLAYGYARALAGAPTRRKGRHAQTLSRRVEVTGTDLDGVEVRALVPIKDIPPYDLSVILPVPGILRGQAPDGLGEPRMELHVPESNPLRKLRERLNWKEINTPVMSFPITGFMRTLAKIGHAFASAELPRDHYQSTLCPFILGDTSHSWYHVGGFEPDQAQSWQPLSLRIEKVMGQAHVIVDVSLHVLPKLPKYQVVCGRYLGEA